MTAMATPCTSSMLNLLLSATRLADDEECDHASVMTLLDAWTRTMNCGLQWISRDNTWTVPSENEPPETRPDGLSGVVRMGLFADETCLGEWIVWTRHPRAALDTLERECLTALARLVARGLSRSHRLESEIRLRQRAEVFLKVSKVLEAGLSLRDVLQEAVDLTWQFVRPECIEIYLDRMHDGLDKVAHLDFSQGEPGGNWRKWLHERMLEGLPLFLPDAFDTLQELGQDAPPWVILIPLARTGAPSGILVLRGDHGPQVWPEGDEELVMGIAELLAIAIENEQLVEEETAARSAAIVASELAREREALIRQIVHDLRNATQAICLANEELARITEGDPGISRHLSTIDRQVDFISSFLREKLAWVRETRDGLRESGCDPDQVLEQLDRRYSLRFKAQGQSLEWHRATERTCLPLASRELETMLSHLLDNALRHTGPGTRIHVSVAVSDGWATFYVVDNGPGLPDDLRNLTSTENGGLSTVKRLATLRGGLFGHGPVEPTGSSFHLTLPTTGWGRA